MCTTVVENASSCRKEPPPHQLSQCTEWILKGALPASNSTPLPPPALIGWMGVSPPNTLPIQKSHLYHIYTHTHALHCNCIIVHTFLVEFLELKDEEEGGYLYGFNWHFENEHFRMDCEWTQGPPPHCRSCSPVKVNVRNSVSSVLS